ncbi:MAG: BMP family ABC transporter substrate-binding protein [Anaerolineales bacterium]
MQQRHPNRRTARGSVGFALVTLGSAAALTLAGCIASVVVETPTAVTPQPAATATTRSVASPAPPRPTSTPPSPTIEPSETPTATATAAPAFRVVLITADNAEGDSSVGALSHAGALAAAAEGSFEYERSVTRDAPAALARYASSGANVVAVAGNEFTDDTLRAARDFPDVIFVGVDQQGAAPQPANYVQLGGPGTRYDQLGFVAGAMAGLATETEIVGALTPNEGLIARNYAAGFIHGVRLTCGVCEYWTTEEQAYDLAAGGQEAVERLQRVRADVLFAAPGPAGDAAQRAAAAAGMWVVGAERDQFVALFDSGAVTGAEMVLPSPILRPDVVLAAVLDTLATGALPDSPLPFSYSNGAMGLAATSTGGLTLAEMRIIEDILARLESGQLGTGVDPLTGEDV